MRVIIVCEIKNYWIRKIALKVAHNLLRIVVQRKESGIGGEKTKKAMMMIFSKNLRLILILIKIIIFNNKNVNF